MCYLHGGRRIRELAGVVWGNGGEMRRSNRLAGAIMAGLFVVGLTMSAQAQTTRWTGFYAGLNAGVTSANSWVTKTAYQNAPGGLGTALALGYLPLSSAPNNGFIGGAQVGYSRMLYDFVVGAETDFQWVSASTTVGSSPTILSQQTPMLITRSQTWLGTTRAKLGFTPMPYMLVYGTGGLAYGDTNLSVAISSRNVAPPINSVATQSMTRVGWTAGAGVEFAIADRWSIKGEWLYYDLGTSSVTNPYSFANSSLTTTVYNNGQIFRGGVNYKF
jgi:outer membrane immunogenic protein